MPWPAERRQPEGGQLWLDELLANNTVSAGLAVLGPQLMSTFWPD